MKEFFTNQTNQKRLALAAAVHVVGASAFALYSNIARKPQAAKIIPIVRTYTVGNAVTAAAATYPGEVRGRYESQLAFQVAGKIAARMVNVGASVQAGQVLLALDPKDVAQNVEATAAQLASARASYKLAADNAARYCSLYAQGAVSAAIRDQYNPQREAASAALRQAQAQATVSSNQVGYTQLVSDTAGVVTALNGEVGQVVGAGTPIATVVRAGEREVQISVPEGTEVSVGQQASVSFWALPGVEATGHVREIASMADPVTRTYKVCVAVTDLPKAAKLGMTAKVSLGNNHDNLTNSTDSKAVTQASASAPTFTLPAQALYQVNNKTQVWLVQDNKAQLVDVVVAGYAGNDVIISQGLSKGDRVITAGLAKLVPEQEVRPEEGGDK